mgnify:FL=1
MKDIIELLQRYFDLLYTCDVGEFDKIFHDNAKLQTVGSNGYVILRSAEYKEVLRKRKSPASTDAAREDEIVTIDQSSDTSAFAKTRALINGTRYCDYLSLLRIDGRWVIVAKVYCVVAQ